MTRWYAQDHEDEIIADILDLIGIQNEWCFEVGAGDPVEISNTKHFRDIGWSALLVDCGDAAWAKLQTIHDPPRINCVNERVDSAEQLELLLDAVDAPTSPDFGVIDVDGEDYWLWHDLQRYRPRIMCVEFGATTDGDVLPARGTSLPARRQAGANRIRQLGESKGYAVAAKTMCNVVFIDGVYAECLDCQQVFGGCRAWSGAV